jgi:multidrug efflux pump subunit AcrA (membrane-fusion protein)
MNPQANEPQESVDLAALGRTYTPPAQFDTSAEVSDVIAKMPWWAARGLVYIIAGFIVVATIWASLSMIDVVAESRGALVPEGDVETVQAAGGGMVQNVFVREGEQVERGQALVQLVATEMQPTTIAAPVSGQITTLEAGNAGMVLQAGQTVATIAPAGARLVAEVRVPNQDIAFIQKGLPAKLKVDAFPFQDYGTIEGTVIEVSPDAQFDKDLGSFYKVTIAPKQTEIAARGRNMPLRLGLTLTAEIVTERKSILSLILEPFRELKSESAAQ